MQLQKLFNSNVVVVQSREGGQMQYRSCQLMTWFWAKSEKQKRGGGDQDTLPLHVYIALATDEPHTFQSPSIKGLRWALFIVTMPSD